MYSCIQRISAILLTNFAMLAAVKRDNGDDEDGMHRRRRLDMARCVCGRPPMAVSRGEEADEMHADDGGSTGRQDARRLDAATTRCSH
jgi:hypothetical protein